MLQTPFKSARRYCWALTLLRPPSNFDRYADSVEMFLVSASFLRRISNRIMLSGGVLPQRQQDALLQYQWGGTVGEEFLVRGGCVLPNHKFTIYVKMHAINRVLEVDQHPLPRPENLFSTVAIGKVFSKLDLLQVYISKCYAASKWFRARST